MFTAFKRPLLTFILKPSMRCVASTVIAFDLNKNNNNKGIRTEPEVECVEARTHIKAGAPVCSGSLLCSLSNEP